MTMRWKLVRHGPDGLLVAIALVLAALLLPNPLPQLAGQLQAGGQRHGFSSAFGTRKNVDCTR